MIKDYLKKPGRITTCLLAVVLLISGIRAEALTVYAEESTSEVTVSSTDEFLAALEQKKSPIIVNGVVSVSDGADENGSMYPVYIAENTVIRGGDADENGNAPCLAFRCPVQLAGDNVTIEDIEMEFVSSTALGSVPHREIFLAGHSLTLDNVSTYLEGGDSSLGGLGGTESELLPTVYAGGFKGTSVGSAASLTIQNANEDTVFQAVYLGHDAGTDSKTAYMGQASLQMGQKVSIRDGIFTDANSSASIEIVGTGEDVSSNNVNNIAFYGNENTVLVVKNASLNKTTVSNVGSLVLDENAVFELKTGSFNNITVKNGACLNLNGVQDVIVSGDFIGGVYDAQNQADTRGILVLNKEGSLTIEGTVRGETLLQTENKNFPGEYTVEKTYVTSADCEEGSAGFVLPDTKTSSYELTCENNSWTVYERNVDITVAQIKVVSSPSVIDINTIIGTDFVPAENAPYCEIVWKDANGNALDAATVDAMMLYYYDMILAVKTEYWESDEALAATDWGNPIEFAVSDAAPGKYYFYVDEANTALSGNYTFILLSEVYSIEPVTVADVKALKESGLVKAEFEVAFYNSANGEPEPEPEPKPEPIDIAGETITVSAIENQIYTGSEICPEVVVKDGTTVLQINKDYNLGYTNNINVGTATVTITGKGNYCGTRDIFFLIEAVEENKKSGTIENNGGKVDWEIDPSGKLTVTGSGEVFPSDTVIEDDETSYAEELPWYEYREFIKSASITVDGITNVRSFFYDCYNLKTVDVSGFDTSQVTNMSSMFGDCSSLETLDLSNFDMKNVTSASGMLDGCSNLKEIKTPLNVAETFVIGLPYEEGYAWYTPEMRGVTKLPVGLTESVTIIKKSVPVSEDQTYTVTFDTMGGSAVDIQKVEKDGFILEPDIPVKDGYTLCGWSKNDSFTEDWDFETDIVQENITLYARWEENVLGRENTDTGICVEIMDEDSYVYNGKKIYPKVKVWDANKVLTEGVDYKVSYKNNVNACDHTNGLIKDSKKPQVLIQGIGAYKSTYKLAKYFSIKQADMTELEITVPQRVAAKTKNKLQKVSPVVKTDKIKVSAKNYEVSYYMDDALTNKVNGITEPGLYYITVEAKKNKENIYSGNFKGVSEPIEIRATVAAELLDKAKVSVAKNLVVNSQTEDTDAAIRTVITQLKIGNSTYKTAGDALNIWKQYFEVSAIDYDGSKIGQDDFYKILHSAGTKTVVIRTVEGNDKNYIGESCIKITVKGTKLKKDMFKLTYGSMSDKALTQTDYTAHSMVPAIYTELIEGKDYQVDYKSGKKVISEDEIVNAGTYTAVISGKNEYSGNLAFKFAIKKVNLATAYKNGKLTIVNDGQPVEQSLAGAGKEITISYDADGSGDLYQAVGLTNADYKVSYKNNKKVSVNGKTAYISLTGKGNFTGVLKGDGKADSTSTKNGIAKELNYLIGLKDMSSPNIQVLVKGLVSKKSKITGVKFEVYDLGKKLASSEYSSALSEAGENLQLTITGKDKNYTGSKAITMNMQLVKASDSKNVKIFYKENQKYYYNGASHQPELVIKDKAGNEITDCFLIEYGENVRIGKGTITVTGKLENGYCDKKVLKFTILPKWMQWTW